ncbi:LysE family transporter, partial [Gelidibacter sp.]|uniref:LysE family transporter n=1 Tax=Gelidibacter sp. TaxID=2018083 RepID=UPI0032634C7D
MFDEVLSAIPFGIILAFTIGPVFFVLLETSATKGFKSALIFNLGVMLADVLFIAIA